LRRYSVDGRFLGDFVDPGGNAAGLVDPTPAKGLLPHRLTGKARTAYTAGWVISHWAG
jgi:hypothetical protein